MKSSYIDQYVVCPFYSREESSIARKIHCEGYKRGTHIHLCFDSKVLKKSHKKEYCKNEGAYHKCPLYPIIAKQYREGKDDE